MRHHLYYGIGIAVGAIATFLILRKTLPVFFNGDVSVQFDKANGSGDTKAAR